MNPELAALDRALARKGETMVLRRRSFAAGSTEAKFDAELRAIVRGYSQEELVGGITQTDSLVIISPTDLKRAQWQSGRKPSEASGADGFLPVKGDYAIIRGRTRMIEAVGVIYVGPDAVRIEMRVLG